MNEMHSGGYAPDTRNWRQRCIGATVPQPVLVDLPEDAEGFAPGYTRTDVHMHLDLREPAAHCHRAGAARGSGEPGPMRDRGSMRQKHVLGGAQRGAPSRRLISRWWWW